MSFVVSLNWKPFNVDTATVSRWMKSNFGESFNGVSAAKELHVVFNRELTAKEIEMVEMYWDAITEESEEAVNYVPASVIREKISQLKQQAVKKSWEELGVAQRKIMMGLTPDREDLGL